MPARRAGRGRAVVAASRGAGKKKRSGAAALVDKAMDCLARQDLPSAAEYFERALQAEPNNPIVLDSYAEACAELGQQQRAIELWTRSIQVAPDDSFAKYMFLGQLQAGAEALTSYQRGLQLLVRDLQSAQQAGAVGQTVQLKEQLVSAYCAVADLFLTDLCFEPTAETQCEQAVNSALQVDASSREALQLLCSLRMSQSRLDDARTAIMQSVRAWAPELIEAQLQRERDAASGAPAEAAASSARGGDAMQADDDNSDAWSDASSDEDGARGGAGSRARTAASAAHDDDDDDDDDDDEFPPFAFRTQAAKLLLEVGLPGIARDICETLMVEDDEDIEVLYVTGLACSQLGDHTTAIDFAKRALALATKVTDCSEEQRTQVVRMLQDVLVRENAAIAGQPLAGAGAGTGADASAAGGASAHDGMEL